MKTAEQIKYADEKQKIIEECDYDPDVMAEKIYSLREKLKVAMEFLERE